MVNKMGYISSILSAQSPLGLLLVLFLPALPRLIGYYKRWRYQSSPRGAGGALVTSQTRVVYSILALHTVYRIYQLLWPPFNVFHTYAIPLSADSTRIRSAFAHRLRRTSSSSSGTMPVERLISRFSNLDYRLLYARYGHETMSECGWCSTYDDFAIASLPRVSAPYAGILIILGIMGWTIVGGEEGKRRSKRLRGTFGWVVGNVGIIEVIARYVWGMRLVEGDAIQLDAILYLVRTIFLLLLLPTYIYIPISSTPSDTLSVLLPSLNNTSTVLRTTTLARAAIASDPTLRSQWSAIGKQGEAERSVARQDEFVRLAAERVGLDMSEEGQTRAQAGMWVKEQWRGLVQIRADPEGR